MCRKSTSILCHISLDLRDHALEMAGYQQVLTDIGIDSNVRSSVRSVRAATRIAPFKAQTLHYNTQRNHARARGALKYHS